MSRSRCAAVPLILLIVALMSGPSLALEGAERTLTAECSTGAGNAVTVENLLGSVRVVPSESAGIVRVEALVVAEAKTPEDAAALADSIRLESDPASDVPRIHVAWPVDRIPAFRPPKSGVKGLITRWTAPMIRGSSTVDYDGRLVQVGADRKATGLSVHLTVSVPYDATASIRQSVGTIEARALRGRLRLETLDGDISVERCFGTVRVETERGVARVHSIQGEEVDVRSTLGGMELADVRVKRVRLRTESGTIQGSGVTADELVVESAGGDVKLAGLEPTTAEVTTGSGKIDVATHLKTMRKATMRTATGDIVLRVGELTHFDLFAESRQGVVKALGLSFDFIGQDGGVSRLRHGQGGPELSVSALGGSVTVRPYDGSRLELFVDK